MTLEVLVGGWEHECCGVEVRPNDVVTWRVVTDAEGRTHETHHEAAGARTVTGRVASITAVVTGGAQVEVNSLPSGRALRGLDDMAVLRLDTGEPFPLDAHARFMVSLSI